MKSLLTIFALDAIIHIQRFVEERKVQDDDAYDVHAYDDVLPSRRAFFYIIDTWIIRYLLLKEVRQNFLFLRWIYDVYFSTHQY